MIETATGSAILTINDAIARRGRLLTWTVAHPRFVDVLVAILTAGACIVAALSTRTLDWPVTVAAAVASGVALLWRRSQPTWVIVAVAMFAGVGYSPLLALVAAVAVFTVASRAPTIVAIGGYLVPVLASMLATTVKTALNLPAPAPDTVAALGLGVTILEPLSLIGLTIGIVARSRRQSRQALEELIAQRIDHVRTLERTRITAEMHDVVGHSLTVMIALANGAAVGWRQDPVRSEVALRELSKVGAHALSDMQRTLRMLRDSDAWLDDALHSSGYDVPPLEQLVEVFRTAGLPVVLRNTGPALPDDPILRLGIYRIVQEALTNALRYAVDPSQVEVLIGVEGETVQVTVADDGRPSKRESVGAGRGLLGIAERAVSLGGTSEAGPRNSGGWSVMASIPTRSSMTAASAGL